MEWFSQFVALIQQLIEYVLHMDLYLNQAVTFFGPWSYAIFFMVIFCETGLVVTPFLPGDSFLFALGALTTVTDAYLSLPLLLGLLFVAAVLGDATNYSIGRYIGPKIFRNQNSKWLNPRHLLQTKAFYDKHGGKTIVLARFLPIARTFAPFVAGIGRMGYRQFSGYNILGAALWVGIFLFAGHWFGNLPSVKRNFHFVIFGIILVSVLPVVFEYLKAKRASQV